MFGGDNEAGIYGFDDCVFSISITSIWKAGRGADDSRGCGRGTRDGDEQFSSGYVDFTMRLPTGKTQKGVTHEYEAKKRCGKHGYRFKSHKIMGVSES